MQPNVFRRKYQEIDQKKPQFPDDPTFCGIKKECQGCRYINENYQITLQAKFDRAIQVFDPELLKFTASLPLNPAPMEFGYRCHAKLAIGPGTNGRKFDIGLYKPGTHAITHQSHCPVHAHAIHRAVAVIHEWLEQQSELVPYDQTNHSGDIRYLAIRASHTTEQVLITIIVREDVEKPIRRLSQALRRSSVKVAGLYMNVHPEQDNRIFGDRDVLISGLPKLRDNVCDLSFEISPKAFFQVNPWTAERVYRRVEQLAGAARQNAWDLYSGMGQFALILSRLGYDVTSVEETPEAVNDARHNFKMNEGLKDPRFINARTEDVLHELMGTPPELIVANPSRRGMAPTVVDQVAQALSKNKHSRLIYVSCDHHTLIRDLNILVQDHHLKVKQLEAFDMFPFTDELEWITVVTP